MDVERSSRLMEIRWRMDEHCRLQATTLAVQAIGLVSMFAARLGERSRARRFAQTLFFLSLVAVGVATAWMIAIGMDCWLSCGTTLSVMSVGATIDCGGAKRIGTF